jgi:hypothetical protein
MRFMQRYYHEGAFFRGNDDEADILQGRDFTAPTEQDLVDKSILPEAMQVRRGFGLAGHTRYTHLADQDTTDKGALWFADRKLANQYKARSSLAREALWIATITRSVAPAINEFVPFFVLSESLVVGVVVQLGVKSHSR